jgi:DNA-binding CsgD family transcriptional regulator
LKLERGSSRKLDLETLIKDTQNAYSKLIGFPILTILDGKKMIISESDSFSLFCQSRFYELIQKCNDITSAQTFTYGNMDILAYPIYRTETLPSMLFVGLNNKQRVNPNKFIEIKKCIDSLGAILSILLENYKKNYLLSSHVALQDIHRLSFREKEVLLLILNGYSNRDIAEKLQLSQNTVKNHVSNIFNKLNVSSRQNLIAEYIHIRPILISLLNAQSVTAV